MECIPAIDLKNGKCVRLTQGKFEHQQLYSDDPLTIAKRWVAEGATRLHIIDLDGARTGMPNPAHVVIIKDIIRRLKVPVQVGGGIRTREVIERMINVGINRVIIGTIALTDPLIGEVFRQYGDKIAVGIDARGGMVAVNGWLQQTEMPALQLAQKMEQLGARRIIFTDISRDGMLEGVNLAAVQSLIKAIKIPIIAAGGVSTLEDIADLMAIGADGAILGKALYENKLRLPDALAAVRSRPGAGAPSPVGATSSLPQTAQPDAPAKPYLPWATQPKR